VKATIVVGLILIFVDSAGIAEAQRRIAVIIDTSGSMSTSDKPLYTVQISKILADLVGDDDRQTVTRLPRIETGCDAGVTPSLQIALDSHNRSRFKSELESLIGYAGDNYFAATVRTAVASLGQAGTPRLLLFLADSGGLGNCERPLTQDLTALHNSGAMIAAINIGDSAGAFAQNPAFDFTTPALNSEQLIRSVADVYQRFLGGRNVQTGGARTEVSVQVDNFVKEAFLVVAGDGPIDAVEPEPSNPSAANVETNYRGGGQTKGLDGIVRGYRIVRFTRPAAGRWQFKLAGASNQSGWMLLQDYAIALTLVSGTAVAVGTPSKIEVALTDELTGRRITDSRALPNANLELSLNGRNVRLSDDGTNGDRQSGDGIYTGDIVFDRPGRATVQAHIQAGPVDRSTTLEFDAVPIKWRLLPQVASRVDAGNPVLVKVQADAAVSTAGTPPEAIELRFSSGSTTTLRDDGRDGDQTAGDRIYSTSWTPSRTGTEVLHFGTAGTSMLPVEAAVDVVGHIEFGPPVQIRIGPVKSRSAGYGDLDLSAAKVFGTSEVRISTDVSLPGTTLEFAEDSWQRIDGQTASFRVSPSGPRIVRLRLQTAGCPAACRFEQLHAITLAAMRADGTASSVRIPLSIEVVPDPWYICWAVELVLGTLSMAAVLIVYGYWSPSRFGNRVGIQLSPEEDLSEGAFYPLRAQRGSRSGFFRDARVFVNEDFRVSGVCKNALVRVRAQGKQLWLRCEAGRTVWRRNLDGTWDVVNPEEALVRTGVLYRNDSKSLFFEFRNQ
jgi:hypothetical protein